MPTPLPAEYGPDAQVRDSATPLYVQLAAILAARIERGDFRDAKVSSVVQLQKDYGVSRGTAQRAIALLVEHGLVRASTGKGVYPVQQE